MSVIDEIKMRAELYCLSPAIDVHDLLQACKHDQTAFYGVMSKLHSKVYTTKFMFLFSRSTFDYGVIAIIAGGFLLLIMFLSWTLANYLAVYRTPNAAVGLIN